MIRTLALTALFASSTAFAGVSADFRVEVTNISAPAPVLNSGVFAVADGAVDPGPITPGGSYTFTVYAGPDHRLSVASMYVQSNDWLVATVEGGISLYDASGNALSGEFGADLRLLDAGTEIDQPPGTGADQAPRQAGPDTGADDPNTIVRDTGIDLGAEVSLTIVHEGDGEFTVTLSNTATQLVGGAPLVLSPGAFAVHTAGTAPLYTLGSVDDGTLEPLAEDGDPGALAALLEDETGLASPLAPGLGAVHLARLQSFRTGATSVEGLEWLAEDGDPNLLMTTVSAYPGVSDLAIFSNPNDGPSPGPAMPGDSYSFTVSASPGDHLAFATMLIQSNDAFIGSPTGGIPLFVGNTPVSGDITDQVVVWDSGTEVNQFPGVGPDQAPRQAGPNTGATENGTLQLATGLIGNAADFVIVTVTPL